jgi:hypothetical protein
MKQAASKESSTEMSVAFHLITGLCMPEDRTLNYSKIVQETINCFQSSYYDDRRTNRKMNE